MKLGGWWKKRLALGDFSNHVVGAKGMKKEFGCRYFNPEIYGNPWLKVEMQWSVLTGL